MSESESAIERNNTRYKIKTSEQVRALAKRLPKAWGFVDWALSDANKNENLKADVSMFLLKKALPNIIENSDGTSPQLVGIVIKTNSDSQVSSAQDCNGNKIISLRV